MFKKITLLLLAQQQAAKAHESAIESEIAKLSRSTQAVYSSLETGLDADERAAHEAKVKAMLAEGEAHLRRAETARQETAAIHA